MNENVLYDLSDLAQDRQKNKVACYSIDCLGFLFNEEGYRPRATKITIRKMAKDVPVPEDR